VADAAAYHYTIRDVKRNEDAIVRERIADTVLDNERHNFLAEIKRIRSNKASNCRVVDGCRQYLENGCRQIS